jgi:hypothetical protein
VHAIDYRCLSCFLELQKSMVGAVDDRMRGLGGIIVGSGGCGLSTKVLVARAKCKLANNKVLGQRESSSMMRNAWRLLAGIYQAFIWPSSVR